MALTLPIWHHCNQSCSCVVLNFWSSQFIILLTLDTCCELVTSPKSSSNPRQEKKNTYSRLFLLAGVFPCLYKSNLHTNCTVCMPQPNNRFYTANEVSSLTLWGVDSHTRARAQCQPSSSVSQGEPRFKHSLRSCLLHWKCISYILARTNMLTDSGQGIRMNNKFSWIFWNEKYFSALLQAYHIGSYLL